MNDIPSTADYIGYHAATAPEQVAVVEGGRGVTYRDFYRDIAKMAGALAAQGVAPGDCVAVEVAGFYRHWVILLACEALGAGTLSYNPSEVAALGRRFLTMDRVICSPGAEPLDAMDPDMTPGEGEARPEIHIMDQDWLSAVARRDPVEYAPASRPDPNAAVRIVKSFGTMGILQLMSHTRRVHDFWMRQFRFRTNMDRHSRYLLTVGFGAQAFYVHATSCIRVGGTVVCGHPNELAQDIARYGITHATFLPSQLAHLLSELGDAPLQRRLRQVFTIGAAAAKPVRNRARQMLADEISESYGANETGGICSMDDDGVGTVFPGVTVEVVDAEGTPGFGFQGPVRVRSAGVVGGYLGDSQTDARMFRDGWFYPGDIAVMHDRHRLSLAGRVEDSIDIAGTRYALGELEKTLLAALPAKDICLLTGVGSGDALTILALADGQDDIARIRQGAPALLPDGTGPVTVMQVRALPRGTDGSIHRAKLRWQIDQALAGHG